MPSKFVQLKCGHSLRNILCHFWDSFCFTCHLRYSAEDATKLYRALLILTSQINLSCSNGVLFGHTIGMSLIQISGIYVTIKLMTEVGYPTALLFPTCVTLATFVCTFLYGWIAELSQFSQAAICKLLTQCGSVQVTKKELKSLRPMRLKSGPFYYFTESTAFTYMNFVTDKTVLFLILWAKDIMLCSGGNSSMR